MEAARSGPTDIATSARGIPGVRLCASLPAAKRGWIPAIGLISARTALSRRRIPKAQHEPAFASS